MRFRQTLLIILLLSSIAKADYWVQKANVGGLNRADATGFSLNGKGYIGTGYSGSYQSDWWEYDPASDTWTQKASYPGGGIVEAASFTIGSFGYVVSSPSSNDVYRYDPTANTWTAVAPFPGGTRQAAVAFSINNKGYVCTEWDSVCRTTTYGSMMPIRIRGHKNRSCLH